MDSCANEHGRPNSPVALDFANTVACQGCRVGDALAAEKVAIGWLKRHGLIDAGGPENVPLPELLRLRKVIRSVFAAAAARSGQAPGDLPFLNQASRRSPTYPTLVWNGRERVRTVVPVDGEGRNRVLAELADSAISVVTEGGKHGLTKCAGPKCEHFLIARTSRQLWCSPTGCGNRARAARHYYRVRKRKGPITG